MAPLGAFGSFGSFAVSSVCFPVRAYTASRCVGFGPRPRGATFVGALSALQGASLCEQRQRLAVCGSSSRGTPGVPDRSFGLLGVTVFRPWLLVLAGGVSLLTQFRVVYDTGC